MDYHRQLGLSRDRYVELLERFDSRTYRGRTYRHLPEYRSDLEKGTVLVDGTVVRGFPKIPRTLVLETGVPRQFDDEVVVEEKLNGYNVRVVRVDGDVLAFTRSGMVCPFTTHKVETWLDLDGLFDEHPDLVLCGEVVGPENPYTAHDYPGVDSLAFRAFDLRRRASGAPLPVAARRDVLAAHDVPQVPHLGRFDADEAAERIRGIVRDLDAEEREGVVLSSPDGATLLKYTTSAANRGNLAFAFSLPFDHGQDFMFRRLIREGFQAVEFAEDEATRRERARDLGEAILLPMVDAIREIDDGGAVGERHTVRAEPAVVDDLLDHLRDQGLELVIERDDLVETDPADDEPGSAGDRGDGERVVTFLKRTQATNDRTRAYLDGQIVRE